MVWYLVLVGMSVHYLDYCGVLAAKNRGGPYILAHIFICEAVRFTNLLRTDFASSALLGRFSQLENLGKIERET